MARWLHSQRRIVVECLPACAPDINPVEPIWSQTNHGDLENFTPDDLATSKDAVLHSLTAIGGKRSLLIALFYAAALEP